MLMDERHRKRCGNGGLVGALPKRIVSASSLRRPIGKCFALVVPSVAPAYSVCVPSSHVEIARGSHCRWADVRHQSWCRSIDGLAFLWPWAQRDTPA